MKNKPISASASARTGIRVSLGFFSIFLVLGLVISYLLAVRPVLKILEARSWIPTPCVVISSEVRRHSDSDGSTYSINISYRYTFKGTEHQSNRYHFVGGSSSGYDGKAAVVGRFPAGASATCYVNPNNPTDAVLERGFTPDLWFGLIPLVFVAVGAGGIFSTLRGRRRAKSESPRQIGLPAAGVAPMPGGPVMLKPSASPLAKLIGSVCVAAFWNGIVSVFVYQAWHGWRHGHSEWFLSVFLIPFVVIGLVMIGAVVYFFLALFNPRPQLTVNSNAIPLGDTLDVQWMISGRVDSLQRLRIFLEGREEATYTRGTSTYTDKEVFATVELVNTVNANEMRSGRRALAIPSGTMHSFASRNNKIIWSLRVHGEIRWWPDVSEEFPTTVLPQPAAPPRLS